MDWSQDTSPENAVPKRAPNQGHVVARSARGLVAPLQLRIEAWHRQAARLHGLAVCGKDPEKVKQEASNLAAIVLAARIELESQLNDIDVTVASHSLIRDIRRSLELLRESLHDLSAGPLK